MVKYKLVVLSEPTEGQEDEYNRWYNEVHLADVLRVPGFLAAQRFKLHTPMNGQFPHSYLSIYEIESENPQQVLAGLVEATEAGAMVISAALNVDSPVVALFETCSPLVTAPSQAPA